MSKKITHNEFINRVSSLFDNKIKILGTYVKSTEKINVVCNVCQHKWSPTASSLLQGFGCNVCASKQRGASNSKSNEDFTKEVFDISNGDIIPLEPYVGSHKKIKFQCGRCLNEWFAAPTNILRGKGCPVCSAKRAGDKISADRKGKPAVCSGWNALNEQDVVQYLISNGYSCSYVGGYKNAHLPCEFQCGCGKHFFMSFGNLKHGLGVCATCRREKQFTDGNNASAKIKKETNGEYLLVDKYTGYDNKHIFSHTECGRTFQATYGHILHGNTSCPFCNNPSRGERVIRRWLCDNCVDFESQKRFGDCVGDTSALPFDFYIPSINVAVEYQGLQHYEPVEHFGGETSFQQRKRYDDIKANYCREQGICLIAIPYLEYENIENILSELFFSNERRGGDAL